MQYGIGFLNIKRNNMEQKQTFKLSRFQGYTFSYNKSEPLGDTHPHQKKSNRTEYYSKGGKTLSIQNLSTGKSRYIMNFDERNFNIAQQTYDMVAYKPTTGLDLNTVTNYFLDLYKAFKASDPNYGTYDSVSNRSYFAEGKRCLYLHDFVEYVVVNDRRMKIMKIKTRMEENKQLV